MAGYVHVKGKKESVIPAFFSERKVRTKAEELFSSEVLLFMAVVAFTAVFLAVNSYYKAYKNSLSVEIRGNIDHSRELSFQKKELEAEYMKKISPENLMKKAEELKLEVATADKVIHL